MKSFLFSPYPALPPNVVRRLHLHGARTTAENYNGLLLHTTELASRRAFKYLSYLDLGATVFRVRLHVSDTRFGRASWGHLGPSWGPSWAILGHLGGHLGLSWNLFEPPKSWHFAGGLFQAILGPLGASDFYLTHFLLTSHALAPFFCQFASPLFVALSRGHLGPSWVRLGAVLGHRWPPRWPQDGPSRVSLHLTGGILGPSWGGLGAILGLSWASWGHLQHPWRPKTTISLGRSLKNWKMKSSRKRTASADRPIRVRGVPKNGYNNKRPAWGVVVSSRQFAHSGQICERGRSAAVGGYQQ